jgi:hypothetical protein
MDNQVLIILLGVIGLPICLYLLAIMPNATHCYSCKAPLSMHRQKTFHRKIDGQEQEICKRCYGGKTYSTRLR